MRLWGFAHTRLRMGPGMFFVLTKNSAAAVIYLARDLSTDCMKKNSYNSIIRSIANLKMGKGLEQAFL